MRPLVTFIVPVYDIPTWMLRSCIESIKSQPLPADQREIIVVDDGSREPVAPIEGVTLIRQENGGQASARNAALETARGEWIEFVDADDALLDGWSAALECMRDPGVDVVRIGDSKDRGIVRRTSTTSHLMNENLYGAAWRFAYRRSFAPSLRFTPGIVHEDEEFIALLLTREGGLAVVDRACYYYRERQGSTMTRPDKAHIERRLRDIEGVIVRLHDRYEEVLQRRVAQLTMDYIYNSIRLERSLNATRHRVSRLRERGLWPLPPVKATWKYRLFRLLSAVL